MQYYAKVNTSGPATGFIAVGEMLSEKQLEALGEEKVAELVSRGVLGIFGGGNKAAAEPADTPDTITDESDHDAHDDDIDDNEDVDNEEELPDLDFTEDMVEDEPEEQPAPEPKRKGGKRK